MERVKPTSATTHRNCLACCAVLAASLIAAAPNAVADTPRASTRVEIFATADQITAAGEAVERTEDARDTDFQLYRMDGIQSIEAKLSASLPADPQGAKSLAMQRIQRLDASTSAEMKSAAVGLAKAMQYGIDRIPAIVFDGQAVVYGVTDVQTALDYYRAWKSEERP